MENTVIAASPLDIPVMRHTPGPWQCSARPSGPWWHISAGSQSICTAHACSKQHTPVYAAMFKANADLIAAAPDLLDSVQRLLLAHYSDGITYSGDHPAAEARRAVAKAQGGEPGHWSDCAVHNMPAHPNGPCDCDAA